MIHQITIRWIKTQPTTEKISEVEKQLATNGDWMRMNVYSWFVSTSRSAADVYNSLTKIFHAEDSILVVEIVTASAVGWAPKWVWDWFQQRQQSALGNVPSGLSASPYKPPG